MKTNYIQLTEIGKSVESEQLSELAEHPVLAPVMRADSIGGMNEQKTAAGLQVANATVDYYERRELEHIHAFREMTAQRDELLAALHQVFVAPTQATSREIARAAIAKVEGSK